MAKKSTVQDINKTKIHKKSKVYNSKQRKLNSDINLPLSGIFLSRDIEGGFQGNVLVFQKTGNTKGTKSMLWFPLKYG